MSPVVVDTDIISFWFKNHPIGTLYDQDVTGKLALVSFMTIAELERWVRQHQWGEQRQGWLKLYLQKFTLIPSSPDLCRTWAEVMVETQRAGRRMESADAWIAATALLYDATLFTHNARDYAGVPRLKIVSHGA